MKPHLRGTSTKGTESVSQIHLKQLTVRLKEEALMADLRFVMEAFLRFAIVIRYLLRSMNSLRLLAPTISLICSPMQKYFHLIKATLKTYQKQAMEIDNKYHTATTTAMSRSWIINSG